MEETRFGNIVFIPGPNNGRPPFCNSLFIDDKVKAIIDTASDSDVLKNIKKSKGIDVLINTHYHLDHVTNNYLFDDAQFWVPALDSCCFKSVDSIYDHLGSLRFVTRDEFDMVLNAFNFKERVPDREFSDGDILDFGDTKLKVIHTPGHTPGHSCFYCEEQELLFTADLDMTPFGPWYGDRLSDIGQVKQAVEKLLNIPAKVFITSHDMGILTGDIRGHAAKYLQVIDERESAILDFLQIEHTLDEIASQWFVYKKPKQPELHYFLAEKSIMRQHLAYSISKGEVMQIGDKYVAVN